MKRQVVVPGLAAALAATAACSSGDSIVPNPNAVGGGGMAATSLEEVDLGGGVSAALYTDGSLYVARDGKRWVASTQPAFSVFRDRKNPSSFHDPTEQGGLPWEPSPATDVAMDTPREGVLHLILADQGKDAALVAFQVDIDEGGLLGLGERFDHVDARGAVVPMFLNLDPTEESGTNDAHVPVPFIVDTNGWGLFVASREAGAFDVGASDPSVIRAAFEGRTLEVFLYAPTSGRPIDSVASYTLQTGAPKVPPLWALAPMHWRNEWTSSAQLLDDADQYRTRHIPASALWIDNPWQTSYNDATLDPARFGDTSAMMRAIAAKGFRAVAWSTPYLERPSGVPTDDAQQLWITANAGGFFVEQGDRTWNALGCCYDGGLGMIDFTNPSASRFWQGIVSRATQAGFSGFKLDYGEDMIPEILGARLDLHRADGETERTARSYPLGYHDAYEAALAQAGGDGFVIGRASSYGGQAHVDALWPGDLDNGFEHRGGGKVGGLPAAIVAAQTLATSGFPSFGSDTGGFRGGRPTREALLRWSEHTAFSVVMQLGGGGESHDPWSYDESAASIYAGLAREHMRLVPYLASLLESANRVGLPTIRSPQLAFPNDSGSFFTGIDDEYLLGDLLVAPIVEAGATQREVVFPSGQWVHWFTGSVQSGPTTSTVEAPLGSPPVFARAGIVVPLYPQGIDTVASSSEPGVVTLESRSADVEARVFALIAGAATWPEGSSLGYVSSGNELTISWAPVAPVMRAFVTIDLRLEHGDRGRHPAYLRGAKFVEVSSEIEVTGADTDSFAVDSTGETMWLRLVEPLQATFSR